MTERQGYTTRGRRQYPVITLVTYVFALIAWVVVVNHTFVLPESVHNTHGHGQPQLTDPGVPEAIALSNGVPGVGIYLLMWGAMMVAMMFPSSARVFQTYATTLTDVTPTKRLTGEALFVLTYTFVWVLLGVVPLAVNYAVPIATLATDGGLTFLGAALLVLAVYQLSPFKRRCLRHCRSPTLDVDSQSETHPVRQAWHLTGYDIGACWPLMGLMVVVGSMNVLWMAIITVIISLERLAPGGETLARGVGVVAGIVSVVLFVAALA